MSQLSQSSHQYSIEEADVILQSQLIDLIDAHNSSSAQTADEKKQHQSSQKVNGADDTSDIDQNTHQNIVCGSLTNQQIVNFIPSFSNSNSNTNTIDHNTLIQNLPITKQQQSGASSKPDSKENDLLKKIKNKKTNNKKTNSKNKSVMKLKSQKVNQSKQSLSVEVTKSNRNGQIKQIQRLAHRKKIPQTLYSESQDQPTQNKSIPVRNILNYKPQAISNYRKNRYRKKNYNFEDKITLIKDIRVKLNDNATNLNVKGEIIFIWERQLINQKWAKTQMICIQVYDGSGSVIVAIPIKFMATNGSNVQLAIGKCVQIIRVQVREKYPHRICLLVGQKSLIKIIHRNLVPKQALIQPQKLGLTIKQVQEEPIGRYCNIVCLVLNKSQKQYIRNFKNIDLNLSKLTVYDPIQKKSIMIRLWQERADLHFYTNAVVYLLRGVQIRQFKGMRQYHSSKDFNYRVLSWSMIEQYLLPLYEQREKKIEQIPEGINKISVKDSLIRLERYHRKVNKLRISEQQKKQKIMKESYPEKSKQIPQNIPQQSTVNGLWANNDSNKKNSLNVSALSAKYKISESEISEILKQKVHVVWSICTIKILAIEIKSNYTIKYSKCSVCMSRIMRNCFNELICFKCDKSKNSLVGSSYQFGYKSAENFYSIKCQFFDGEENYFGQICQKAANKIFSVEDEPMKLEFFQETNITFKQLLVKQVIGDAVRAVVMSTKEKIDLQDDIQDDRAEKNQQGQDQETKIKLIEKQKQRDREKIWVNGHYIVDILPFEDENQTISHNNGLNQQQLSLTLLK